MTREDWLRLWIHFPIGAIAALVQTRSTVTGLTMLVTTLVYEAFNDWRKHDESYKDVLGIVWGYSIVSIALVALEVLRV